MAEGRVYFVYNCSHASSCEIFVLFCLPLSSSAGAQTVRATVHESWMSRPSLNCRCSRRPLSLVIGSNGRGVHRSFAHSRELPSVAVSLHICGPYALRAPTLTSMLAYFSLALSSNYECGPTPMP